MLVVEIFNHNLNFKTPGGTSRGVLKNKPTWYIKIYYDNKYKIKVGKTFFQTSSVDVPNDIEKIKQQMI